MHFCRSSFDTPNKIHSRTGCWICLVHPPPPFSFLPLKTTNKTRRVLYFPISALITLFANILENPMDPGTRSDLRLMNSFVEFLAKLPHEPTGELKRIFRVCSEFERIAKECVERAKDSRFRNDANRGVHGGDTGRQSSRYRSGPLTPDSTIVRNPGLSYSSPTMTMYSNTNGAHVGGIDDLPLTDLQNFPAALNGPGALASNQFNQAFQGILSGGMNMNSEIQPMFPNGLTMPWNGNMFHGQFNPESFGISGYDFGAM